MSYDKTIIMGNLTRDIEIRTAGSTSVGNFGIAVNRKYKTAAGEQREEVCFLDCEAWGRTAETMCQYLKRGDMVLIEGRHKLEQWEDKKDASKRSKIIIVVESFSFCGGKGGGEQQGTKPAYKREAVAASSHVEINHDDIPF